MTWVVTGRCTKVGLLCGGSDAGDRVVFILTTSAKCDFPLCPDYQ